jgi:hypothetical protein
MAQIITDPHLRAELACCHGHCKPLADYFKRTEWPPSHEVLKALSRHLDGSNNWNLRFVVRNGRPPKIRSGALWEEGQERALADKLYLLGERIAYNLVSPSETPNLQTFLAELANAFDPRGNGRWKLSFERPRRGNPISQTRSDVKLAMLGQLSLRLRAELGNWNDADVALRDQYKVIGDDNSTRKKAVRFYMKSLARTALDLFDELGDWTAVDAALCEKFEAIKGSPNLREKAIRLYRRP